MSTEPKALTQSVIEECREALKAAREEIRYWHSDLLSDDERNHPRGSGWARVYDQLTNLIARLDHAGDVDADSKWLVEFAQPIHRQDAISPVSLQCGVRLMQIRDRLASLAAECATKDERIKELEAAIALIGDVDKLLKLATALQRK